MALFVVINLFIFDEGDDIHIWLGYGTLALVLLRTIIGFTAQGFEAFNQFPIGINDLFSFLKNLFNHKAKDYVGHNPAASYAYIIFWFLIVGLGVSGILLEHVDAFFVSESLEELHDLMADAVIVFIVVHFTGMLLDSILHKRKAWMSIITGKK